MHNINLVVDFYKIKIKKLIVDGWPTLYLIPNARKQVVGSAIRVWYVVGQNKLLKIFIKIIIIIYFIWLEGKK